jgi:hypothetical protein
MLVGTKLLALALTVLLMICIVTPQPAYAQLGGIGGLFSAITNITSQILGFINNTMRPILEGVRSAAQAIEGFLGQLRNFWEQVIWPVSEINRARALATQLIANFRSLLDNLYAVNVSSAQLPRSIALEGVMRNHQANDHSALVTAFQQTFGAPPAAVDAHPQERNLIDIDDALAVDQLMTLKLADASADQTLQAATRIEDEGTQMAPGTAAMVSAAAFIAAVQSQAHIQKMIAGQLRQEAARMAHDNMVLKRGSVFTRESRTRTQEMNR